MKRILLSLWIVLAITAPALALPWVDVAQYASLTAAVTAIGTTETDLLIDSTTTCTADFCAKFTIEPRKGNE